METSRRDFLKGLAFTFGTVAVPGALCKAAEHLTPIEPIAAPVEPPVIWGHKTLQASKSTLDELRLRKVVVSIQHGMNDAMEAQIGGLNDAVMRRQVCDVLSAKMNWLKHNYAVYDYSVICDESNNTVETGEAHQVVMDVYFKCRPGGLRRQVRGVYGPK